MSLCLVPQGRFHFRSVLMSNDPREELIQEQKLQKSLWERKWDRRALIPKSKGDGGRRSRREVPCAIFLVAPFPPQSGLVLSFRKFQIS